MKVSEKWLREWVDPPVSTAQIAEQLTMAGLEVDAVRPAAPAFDNIVVGRVVELSPHSTAGRLQIAKVDVGSAQMLQIVTGAPNVFVGMCAPAALAGAMLPNGFKVEESSIRGIASQGMLCSSQELGLTENAEGLMALPADTPPGQRLNELLGSNDRIIELDLTPNRGDCLGMAGIAREIGALNRCEVFAVDTRPVAPVLEATFPVEVHAFADCPRYAGRVVRDVHPLAETPLWMCERLRRAGLRSLGPLVDVTNYVMLELGQPMHAFDLDRLSGGIVVRRAQAGERLKLLNGEEVELDPETLVIADRQGPVAMAGIIGGEASAVGDDTRHIFLESAFFNPLTVTGCARGYSLHTDSSHRFERGVDPQLQVRALERATRLLVEIAGGSPGPAIEVASKQHLAAEAAIRLRPERIRRLLGLDIADDDLVEILERLGMAVADEGSHWLVVPPSFRFDLALEADLIEEIGRVYGYDRLPSRRPTSRLTITPQPESEVRLGRLREILVQRGFQEAITYSFVDPAFQKALDPEREPIALANPISADLSVMRTSLWPGLIKALDYNQKRQQSRVRLYEYGLVFTKENGEIRQEPRLAGAVCGDALPEQWGVSRRAVDFFDLKGDVEALTAPSRQAYAFKSAQHPALHPGQAARIEHEGVFVGWIGALHPAVERQLDLDSRVFVFELKLEPIRRTQIPQFEELSKFPAIRRDIAVVVDEAVSVQQVANCIRRHGGEILREVRLFDLYRGKGIAENQKSLAFGLILQDFSRTLTDSVVEEIVSKIVSGLKTQLGATLRV